MANSSSSSSASFASTSGHSTVPAAISDFERVKNAVTIQDVLGIFKRVINAESLHQLLSQENFKGTTLEQKIKKNPSHYLKEIVY